MKGLLLTLGLSLSPLLWALQVVPDSSYIRFISVKKESVAEIGRFTRFVGTLSEEGGLRIDIDLSSVDTKIDVRDQRMREFLFETVQFPSAQVVARVDMSRVDALKAGQEINLKIPGSVNLHGLQQEVDISVAVVRLSDGSLRATTTDPILLSLKDFALLEGVEKLQDLASLSGIDRVVPVYLSLHLR